MYYWRYFTLPQEILTLIESVKLDQKLVRDTSPFCTLDHDLDDFRRKFKHLSKSLQVNDLNVLLLKHDISTKHLKYHVEAGCSAGIQHLIDTIIKVLSISDKKWVDIDNYLDFDTFDNPRKLKDWSSQIFENEGIDPINYFELTSTRYPTREDYEGRNYLNTPTKRIQVVNLGTITNYPENTEMSRNGGDYLTTETRFKAICEGLEYFWEEYTTSCDISPYSGFTGRHCKDTQNCRLYLETPKGELIPTECWVNVPFEGNYGDEYSPNIQTIKAKGWDTAEYHTPLPQWKGTTKTQIRVKYRN